MRSINEAVIKNNNVFIRMDYNVGIDKGRVLNDYKIKASFSTIKDVYYKNPARIIIGSHLGRPKGHFDKSLSCLPIFDVLQKMIKEELKENLYFCKIEDYKGEKFVLLENLRFYPEEQKNLHTNTILSDFFKKYVDILIVDAFGVLHREEYSTCLTGKTPFAGNLVRNEYIIGKELLNDGVELIILGGSKIKDKVSILESLVPNCKSIFVLGALACSFLKYHYNVEVGKSKVEEDVAEMIERIYKLSNEHTVNIYLPQDYKVLQNGKYFLSEKIPKDGEVVDIGLKTIEQLEKVINKYESIFWNGPPGIFENFNSSAGSEALVKILAKKCKVVVGGGETSACVCRFGNVNDFFHVSTGGGAFLKLLGNEKLPGIDLLLNK